MGSQLTRAEELACRALELASRQRDPQRVAVSLNNLAATFRIRGRYSRVEKLYSRAVGILVAELGGDHAALAICYNNLGVFHQSVGNTGEAREAYRTAIEILEKREDGGGILAASVWSNLANLHLNQRKWNQAESLYKRALAKVEESLPEHHAAVARLHCGMARLYIETEKFSRAESMLEQALRIQEKLHGQQHLEVADCLVRLATLYLRQMRRHGKMPISRKRRAAQAEDLFRRGLSIRESHLGPRHPAVAQVLRELGDLCQEVDRLGDAANYLTCALEILLKIYGPYHTEVADCLEECARLEARLGHEQESRDLHQRAQMIRSRKAQAGPAR